MAQHSGFFNAVLSGGTYDRKYNADNYTNNLAVIISDGVLRSEVDDLKPTANGMEINIRIGRAWIRGRWYQNDTDYNLVVPAPSPAYARKDRVFLRLNSSIAVRSIELYYAQGVPASNPVPPEPMDTETIKDLVLCEVDVPVSATSVTITDTRSDPALCGWVYSVKGDDAFFTSLDNTFEDWLQEKKEKLASVTLFKQYLWRGHTNTDGQKVVVFNIPQYDPTGVDILQVYFNGILEVEDVDYTVTDSTITFVNGRTAGQEIIVICYKSIDGTGLGTVAEQVDELENTIATLGDISDYNYICNGANDNVLLSEIAQDFLNGENDGKTLTIHVYGNIGVDAPVKGSGSESAPYVWFNFGVATAGATSRRICFDFENTGRLTIAPTSGAYNTIFDGVNVCVKNIKCRVEGNTTDTSVVVFGGKVGNLLCERCVFTVFGNKASYFAANGVFRDSSVAIFNANDVGRCFIPAANSFLRVFGGDYSAYASAGRGSAAVFVNSAFVDAVVITDSVSFPTASSSGYSQGYAVYDLSASGKCVYAKSVTTLIMSATGQVVRDTIRANQTTGTW